jgi:long-chain acyl-CoA synthetase
VDHRLARYGVDLQDTREEVAAVDSTNRPTHLADLVEAVAARHAGHPALIDAATDATLTWGDLDAAVSAEARRLTGAGVAAGDRVVIRCARGPALTVAVLGALRAGAVAVPVGPGDVGVVVAHCTPRLLVDDEASVAGVAGVAEVAEVVEVEVVGPPDLTDRGAPLAAVGGGEDIALMLYTTGTRAVCLSHRAVLANRAQAAALRPAPVTPVDRVLLAQPLFHAYGLAAGLFQICWAGATAVLPGPGRPDAEELADTVARHRVSGLAGVPSTYRALLDVSPERLRTALAGLRLCTCGGVPLPRPWAAAFQEATGHRIVEGYGLTEAGPVVTSTPIDGIPTHVRGADAARRGLLGEIAVPGSMGRPLPGIELRLVDRDGRPMTPPSEAVAATADDPVGEPASSTGEQEAAAIPEPAADGSNAAEGSEPEPAGTGSGTTGVRPEAGAPGTGAIDVRTAASRVATDVRAVAERGVAEFRAVAERAAVEVRAAAERAATEVRAAVLTGDPVGDMIDDAQDVEGPADPASDAGLIALRGPHLFSGYWPGPTGGPDADGWFVTSDMGFLDGSGALHLVDRTSDLVVVSGFTVYPHEVERVLGELPSVAEAAMVGVPDERTGQAVRAVVVRAAGAELDADAVRAHCRARLARFKVPAQVVFVDELPRTAAGRLDRHLLVDPPPQA